MVIDFYHIDLSPPCRGVLMVAKELGIELNMVEVNLMKKEQFAPEFLKINPQHTVPVMIDGDVVLSESRAIMCYLVNEYCPGHKIYPACPKKRAVVDRFLYFDIGTLYQGIYDYFYPPLIKGKPFDPVKEQEMKEKLKIFEEYLGDKTYITGDDYIMADLSMAAGLTMFDITNYGFEGFAKTEAYYNRMKQFPYWDEVHQKGFKQFRDLIAENNKAKEQC